MAKSNSEKLVSPRKKKTTHKKTPTQNKHRVGGSKKSSTKKVSGESKKKIIRPRLEKWKLIETIGEKQADLVQIKNSKDWDFSNLHLGIQNLLQQYNDGSTFFVFGSQPHTYYEDGEAKFAPTISVIRVPPSMEGSNHPKIPPPFVSMQNPQQGTDEVITIGTYKLTWVPFSDIGDGRVFALQRDGMLTRRSELKFEYLQLYSIIPSKDCPRKEDGVIDIRKAMFTYIVDGEEIDEQYEKGVDSFTDFCNRFDLDAEEHKPKVKAAVKEGFDKVRAKLETRLALLQSSGYNEALLENIRAVAKFYPRNEDLHGLVVKDPYVNQYYGEAAQIL